MTLHVKDSSPISPDKEEVLYGDGMVWVTDRRLIFNEDSYDLRGVKGVEIRSTNQRTQLKQVAFFAALCIAMSVVVALDLSSGRLDYFPFDLLSTLGSFCLGLFVIVMLGALILIPTKIRQQSSTNVFGLTIKRTLWRDDTLATLDRWYLENIAQAVKYSISLDQDDTPIGGDFATTATPPQFAMVAGNIISGDNTISLNTVESASVSSPSLSSQFQQHGLYLGIMLPVLARVMDRQFDFPGEMLLWTVLVIIALFSMGQAFLNPQKSHHIVTVRRSSGEQSEVVFISPNKAEADAVKTDIERAIQGSAHVLGGVAL